MDADILQGPDCIRGKQTIKESKGHLERLKRTTWDEVSHIRIEADDSENKRRQKEDKRRIDRYQMIRNETIQSSTKNEAAQIKWDDLLGLEDCEELFQSIQEQKKECMDIIQSKQQLIEEFIEELKEKDAFYVKSLAKQEDDVDKIIEMMRRQYTTMRDEYAMQLQIIEDGFLAERADLLKANRQEIDELFKRHRELEEKYNYDRLAMEEANADELENKREDDANNLQRTKVSVENNLQALETYMEEMKAVYQLNLEKLSYNVKILQERASENETTISDLTRRKRNLKTSYLNLNAKVEKKEEDFMKANAALTDKFKKMSKAFNELRKKFRHFEKADTQRFNEIWAMNEAEVKDLASKVLKCDKIVYEQQLGLQWTPPEDTTLNIDLGSLSEVSSKQKEDSVSKQPSTLQVSMVRIKQVFSLLVSECSFLLEDKVRDQCLGKSEKEQFTLKIDSIRKTMGIETMEDVQTLINLFYYNNRRDELYESDLESPETSDPDVLLVHPDQVIDILNEFNEFKNERKGGGSSKANEASALSMKSVTVNTEKERREKILQDEKKHWENLGNILSDKHLRVWKALERAFQLYYNLLQDRQNLVEETGVLHQQNEELKSLLQQYLQAGVNQELQVPPTQMLRIGEDEED